MPDTEIPPQPSLVSKRLTIPGLVVSSMMSGALICGVIGGLAVLFMADGVIDVGPDPAIPNAQVTRHIAEVDQRIKQLEQAAQKRQTTPAPAALQELQQGIAQNTEQTEALEQKIDTLSASKHQESKAAQIALGLTQIKTAYENDLPIATGVETLKSAVSSEALQKTLDDLTATTSQNFPSKKELLTDIEHFRTSLVPTPVDPKTLTWDQRAKLELNKFVTVQPQQVTAQQALLTKAEQSIRNNDLMAALDTIKQLPASTEQSIFYKKVELRARAEGMIYSVITGVTQKVDSTVGGAGTLY